MMQKLVIAGTVAIVMGLGIYLYLNERSKAKANQEVGRLQSQVETSNASIKNLAENTERIITGINKLSSRQQDNIDKNSKRRRVDLEQVIHLFDNIESEDELRNLIQERINQRQKQWLEITSQ